MPISKPRPTKKQKLNHKLSESFINLGDRLLNKAAIAADIAWLLKAYHRKVFKHYTPGSLLPLFQTLWLENAFFTMHDYPVCQEYRKVYLNSLFGCVLQAFESDTDPEKKSGSIFMLYFIYYSQPGEKLSIPLTPYEMDSILTFETSFEDCDILTVLEHMKSENVFYIVPISCNPNSKLAYYVQKYICLIPGELFLN
jgi:hypothetical protein